MRTKQRINARSLVAEYLIDVKGYDEMMVDEILDGWAGDLDEILERDEIEDFRQFSGL